MELKEASQKDFLGIKVYSIRIGCLGNNNKKTTFTARQQAIRFFNGENSKQNDGFKKGWEPSRLRATRQCNDFLCNTAFALTIFLAEEQKELEEKEKEKEEKEKEEANRADRAGYDGDGDGDADVDESEDDESLSFKTPAKPKSDPTVTFDMNEANAAPINWQSPNGKTMTAIRIPRAGTRKSFRKLAQQTSWIDNVVKSMFDDDKVPEEVAVEWLVEGIFDRFRPYFEAFCERKGYMLPTMARMPPRATAAMWTIFTRKLCVP
jgi:hypothetical protein